MSGTPTAFAELCALIDEAGLQVRFGLRAQGHVQTIEDMLLDGDDWPAIGREIGWCPETAREWWARLCEVGR